MRRLLTIVLCAGLTAASIRADDTATTKPATSPAFAALKKEYDEVQKKWSAEMMEAQKAMRAAKEDDEKAEAQKKFSTKMAENPGPKFAVRFLEFAEQNPKDSSVCDAIVLAMRGSGPNAKDGTWAKAIALCQANCVTRPDAKKILRMLAMADNEAADKVLTDIAAKNPDRKCQALAYKAMASARENMANIAERLKSNEKFRENYEKQMGKEKVEAMMAKADTAKKEAEEFKAIVKNKYSDIFPDLSVGQPAPEVVIQNVEGKEAKLSALKGKVVVVDIWATWCGPCRAMIPHEREMVERLKEKPFALVSVSADAEKKTLTDFLAKENMPWTHWWNGNDGGIVEDWDVQYFPTIYVIDAKGIIRHKDLRGEELEKAVNELLKDTEK